MSNIRKMSFVIPKNPLSPDAFLNRIIQRGAVMTVYNAGYIFTGQQITVMCWHYPVVFSALLRKAIEDGRLAVVHLVNDTYMVQITEDRTPDILLEVDVFNRMLAAYAEDYLSQPEDGRVVPHFIDCGPLDGHDDPRFIMSFDKTFTLSNHEFQVKLADESKQHNLSSVYEAARAERKPYRVKRPRPVEPPTHVKYRFIDEPTFADAFQGSVRGCDFVSFIQSKHDIRGGDLVVTDVNGKRYGVFDMLHPGQYVIQCNQ